MTDSTPAAVASRRKGLFVSSFRRKTQLPRYHSDSRKSRLPSPTMTSQPRWTTLTSATVGSDADGTELSPWTTVDFPVRGSDSQDARPGILMPPTSWYDEFRWPSRISGASLVV